MLGWILLTAGAAVLGFLAGLALARMSVRHQWESIPKEAARLGARERAEQEAASHRAKVEAREAARAWRQTHTAERQALEDEITEREASLAERRETVADREETLDERQGALEEREAEASRGLDRARSIRAEAMALRSKARAQVEAQAGMSPEACAADEAQRLVDAVRAEAADRVRHLEVEPGAGTIRMAKRIIGVSIERLAHQKTAVRQGFNVEVSAKARGWMQGEGAWLFDAVADATGAQVAWVNDGAAARIETGGGVSRVVARRLLERLVTSLPTTKERVAQEAESVQRDIEAEILGRGRRAFKQLGLPVAHPEIVDLVGRLYFRTSYTQNQWEHSQEAAHLAGLMAAEMGLDTTVARRAALLHDIGKALTHQVEGSHALIGGEIARRCGEPEVIAAAIEEHHGEKPMTSVYSALVAAADGISGARPGARRELVETYGDRIQELERLARGFRGVTAAFAVQAGREVRVRVDEKHVDDARAAELASDVAATISDQMTFPGQIRVTVIREFSAVEIAS